MSEENKKSKKFILINYTIINTEKVKGFTIDEIGDQFRVLACFGEYYITIGKFEYESEAMNLILEINTSLYRH